MKQGNVYGLSLKIHYFTRCEKTKRWNMRWHLQLHAIHARGQKHSMVQRPKYSYNKIMMSSWAYYLYIKISTIHLQSCKVSRPNLSSNRSYLQKNVSYLKLNSLNCMKKTLNRPLQEMELLQVLRSNYFQSHSLTVTSSPLDLHINSFNIHVFWLIIRMVFVQKTGNLIEFGKCSSTYTL